MDLNTITEFRRPASADAVPKWEVADQTVAGSLRAPVLRRSSQSDDHACPLMGDTDLLASPTPAAESLAPGRLATAPDDSKTV